MSLLLITRDLLKKSMHLDNRYMYRSCFIWIHIVNAGVEIFVSVYMISVM